MSFSPKLQDYTPSPASPVWSKAAARRDFLLRNKGRYGFGLSEKAFLKQHEREYPSLKRCTYLDFTASPPQPLSTFHALSHEIASQFFSNPHSRSSSSAVTTKRIEIVRARVLEELFGLKTAVAREDYDLIWTSGATAALKIVAEAFPWVAESTYVHLKEAHSSLVGIRGSALSRGAQVNVADIQQLQLMKGRTSSTLFGVSAQCNATGAKLGLGVVKTLKTQNPASPVVLDAAAYLSTSVLDLSSVPIELAPDFVACSFYKLFGFPTGLGCLVVKRSASQFLRRTSYFGGGSMDALSLFEPYWYAPRTPESTDPSSLPQLHPCFEDGTLPFLSIITLGLALDTHKRLYKSHDHVTLHASSLREFASEQLALLRYANGQPLIKQHLSFAGARAMELPGSTIGFTVLDQQGELVGHGQVDALAREGGFELRSGGLCNIGAMNSAVGLLDEHVKRGYETGHRCGDEQDFVVPGGTSAEVPGIPYGIVRISFGAASTVDDVLDFVEFLHRTFLVDAASGQGSCKDPEKSEGCLGTGCILC